MTRQCDNNPTIRCHCIHDPDKTFRFRSAMHRCPHPPVPPVPPPPDPKNTARYWGDCGAGEKRATTADGIQMLLADAKKRMQRKMREIELDDLDRQQKDLDQQIEDRRTTEG